MNISHLLLENKQMFKNNSFVNMSLKGTFHSSACSHQSGLASLCSLSHWCSTSHPPAIPLSLSLSLSLCIQHPSLRLSFSTSLFLSSSQSLRNMDTHTQFQTLLGSPLSFSLSLSFPHERL